MACCGGGKRRAATQAPAQPVQETRSLPAARAVAATTPSGKVLIRYVGPREGSQTWRSPTNQTYRFSRGEPLQQVAAGDVDWLLQYRDFQRVTG